MIYFVIEIQSNFSAVREEIAAMCHKKTLDSDKSSKKKSFATLKIEYGSGAIKRQCVGKFYSPRLEWTL